MTIFVKTPLHFLTFSPLANSEFGLATDKGNGIMEVLVFYVNNAETI